MPTIAEIVGAKKKLPVMKYDGNIALVDEDRALAVSQNHHGIDRAATYVGKPVWVNDKNLALRG